MPSSRPPRITVWLQKPAGRKFYYLEWRPPGSRRRKSKSTKTDNEREAEQQRADLEYELNNRLYRDEVRLEWDTFVRLYGEEKLGGRREATRKKGLGILTAFGEIIQPDSVQSVGERQLSHYAMKLRGQGRAAATIAGHLAYLRAALRWAARQKFIPAAPAVEMPKLPRKRKIRRISAEELERLLAKAPPGWHLFLFTAWFTGMRRNELLALHWDEGDHPWVDLKAKRIWIPAEWNKADADQWLPLHAELAELLESQRQPSGRLFHLSDSPREVSRKFTAMARKAGLKITLHDLRRSFGSRYAPHVPAQVLQRLMRHSEIRTTLQFHIDVDDQLEQAIDKI